MKRDETETDAKGDEKLQSRERTWQQQDSGEEAHQSYNEQY